jgi:hypothetical protein
MQIRLMGLTYQQTLGNFLSDENIKRRVVDMGHFIRTALLYNDTHCENFKTSRNQEMEKLIQSDFRDLFATTHIEHGTVQTKEGLSHRLARYVVHWDEQNLFKRCSKHAFAFQFEISKEILETKFDLLRRRLEEANRNDIMFNYYIAKTCEWLFEHYVKRGLSWKYRELHIKNPPWGNYATKNDWRRDTIYLPNKPEKDPVAFSVMKKRVLNYPNDSLFPLVDMYWKVSEKLLVAVQVNCSMGYDKNPAL